MSKEIIKLSPAVKRMSPEYRLEKLKEICRKHNVRYYADKAKGHFKFKPIRATEKLCLRLAKYCDYWDSYGGLISAGYIPQDKNGCELYSFERGKDPNKEWVVINLYILRTA